MNVPATQRKRPITSQVTDEKRIKILDAAAVLFAQQGYPDTDVQALADSIGVGKGTIYRAFPTKRDLFLAAVDRGMRLLTAHINDAAANVGDPLERIAEAVRAYLDFFHAHQQYIELVILERAEFKDRQKPTYFAHREMNLDPWKDLIRSLIESGRMREVPVDRITDVLSDLLYGTIFTNHFARRKKSLDRQTQDILDLFFNGTLTPKGGKSR